MYLSRILQVNLIFFFLYSLISRVPNRFQLNWNLFCWERSSSACFNFIRKSPIKFRERGEVWLFKKKKNVQHNIYEIRVLQRGDKILWIAAFFFFFFLFWYFLLQIDENVQREIINHRSLRHPNIVRFKEVSYFILFWQKRKFLSLIVIPK